MKAVLAVKVTHFRLTAKYDIVHIESDTVLYVNISFEEDNRGESDRMLKG